MYRTIGSIPTPAPLTPADIGAQGGTAFDPATMTLYTGNGKIAIIPALLSAVAVKTIMFGGQKVGTLARSKIMGKPATATNPGKMVKSLLPLALMAGGAYILYKSRQGAPVSGLGGWFSGVRNVTRRIAAAPMRLTRVVGISRKQEAPAVVAPPAPVQPPKAIVARPMTKAEWDLFIRPINKQADSYIGIPNRNPWGAI